jgi:hypothetical protein
MQARLCQLHLMRRAALGGAPPLDDTCRDDLYRHSFGLFRTALPVSVNRADVKGRFCAWPARECSHLRGL